MTDFNNAIERIVAGLEKRNRLINPKEREIVAFHEMGHAIAAMAIPGSDPVHKVSIIPRGIGALGYTIQRPLEDRYIVTREELENKMVVLLGGRAAEWIVFQHLSTGASDDLRRVTDIARSMVVQYGMSPALGNVTYERDQRGMLGGMAMPAERAYAETTASQIDREVHDLAERAFNRAVELLTERRALLDATAHTLLEAETLDAAAIDAIAEGLKNAA